MNPYTESLHAWMMLNSLHGVGPITIRKLIETYGDDPHTLLSLDRKALLKINGVGDSIVESFEKKHQYFNVDQELEKLSKLNGSFISCKCKEYPDLLKQIYDPPIGMYCLGNLSSADNYIAIVGCRKPTQYGISIAKELSKELALRGFTIVSGLARGIDAAAHKAALEANKRTIAIMGSAVDIVYPPENLEIYKAIPKQGAVLSESKLGKNADKLSFPRRNRIISGLCRATIVIESDINGGSMITARMANEQGRLVFAVPGNINQTTSRGCNELIRDGAILCTGIDSILEELNYPQQLSLGFTDTPKKSLTITLPSDLPNDEKVVCKSLISNGPSSLDDIASACNLNISDTSTTLLMLELKNLVCKRLDGKFEFNA